MRFIVLSILMALLVMPAAAIPDLEETFTVDGGWRFAGPLGSDDAPDVVEILATGGLAQIWFIDTSPLFFDTPGPVVRWIAGNPPWGDGVAGAVGTGWPWTLPVGNQYLECPLGTPRPFDIKGTGADSLYVDIITATGVAASCSKYERQ